MIEFFLVFMQKPARAEKTKACCDKKPQAYKANEQQDHLLPADLQWYIHTSVPVFDNAHAL
jgi:hypothetical protein